MGENPLPMLLDSDHQHSCTTKGLASGAASMVQRPPLPLVAVGGSRHLVRAGVVAGRGVAPTAAGRGVAPTAGRDAASTAERIEQRWRDDLRLRRTRPFGLLAHLLDAAPAAVLGFGVVAIWGKLETLELRFGAHQAIWSEGKMDFARGGGRRSARGKGDARDRKRRR